MLLQYTFSERLSTLAYCKLVLLLGGRYHIAGTVTDDSGKCADSAHVAGGRVTSVIYRNEVMKSPTQLCYTVAVTPIFKDSVSRTNDSYRVMQDLSQRFQPGPHPRLWP